MRVGTGNTSYESDAGVFFIYPAPRFFFLRKPGTLSHKTKKSGIGGDWSEHKDQIKIYQV